MTIIDNDRVTSFWLDWVPATLAAAASLVAVVIAVAQLSAGSRLRKRASFWSEQLQASDLEHDRTVVQSLHRETLARLVGLSAYPGRMLILPALVVLMGTFGIGGVGFVAGTLAPSVTLDALQAQGLDPWITLGVMLAWAVGIYGAASVIVRRRKIAHHYLEGQDLSRTKADLTILKDNILTTLGILSFSVGTSLLVGLAGFVSGIPKGDLAVLEPVAVWIFILVFVAPTLTLLGSRAVGSLFKQDALEWEHPRALSDATDQLHVDHETTGFASYVGAGTGMVKTWINKLVGRREPPKSADDH